jgi:hypothetical protein
MVAGCSARRVCARSLPACGRRVTMQPRRGRGSIRARLARGAGCFVPPEGLHCVGSTGLPGDARADARQAQAGSRGPAGHVGDSVRVGSKCEASGPAGFDCGHPRARVRRRGHVRSCCGAGRRVLGRLLRRRGRRGRRLRVARGRARRHRLAGCSCILSGRRRRDIGGGRPSREITGRARGRVDGAGSRGGARRRRRRRRHRVRRLGGLRRRRRAAVDGRGRIGTQREKAQRVDVSLRIGSRADSEVDERVAARCADPRSLADMRVTCHHHRSQVQQGRRVPERRLDRDRLSTARDGPGERHRAGGRRAHGCALGGGDVDAPVLPGRVWVAWIEREAANDGTVDGPCPRAGRRRHRETAKQDEHESAHCYLLRCQN